MMPSLREEITKTFTRLTRLGEARSQERAEPDTPDARIGRQFGSYRILRPLGAGGMGQIYLALDTRLGRHVALKFLPPDLVRDEVSLTRLVHEARAASALNHPNILTIHDVGEWEGEHFIASEFVEGITLRTAMERKVVSVQSAIDIASQIASALSAAHAAGVVHRDLKPSNVMLRPDGYIKVIDFGLAKRLARTSEAHRAVDARCAPFADETQLRETDLTRPGTTIGTAEYMSPEQARGEELDYRTDIWSLGIIFYEMLTGHRPFEGATQSHVLVAIQDAPVPPLPADKSISPALHVIVARALAKKPRDRYGSARDMLDALQAAAGLSATAHRIRVGHVKTGLSGRAKALIFPILLAVVFAAGFFWWWNSRQPHWLHIEPVRQLTFNGRVQLATISPDGRYLAYTAGQQDGEQALYLKQIDSAADEIKIRPRPVSYKGLTFSPDSQTLYVVEKGDSDVGRLYELPLIGQPTAVPILAHIDGPVSFSPNGEEMTYVDVGKTPHKLLISSRDGQHTRVLLAVSDLMLLRPAWSPDGKQIAVVLFRERLNGAGEAILDLVKLDRTESRRVLPTWQRIGFLRWTPDSKTILTDVGTYSDPNRTKIHQVSVRTGADQVLTSDLASYLYVSLTANASELTAVKKDAKAVVWVSRPNDFSHGDTTPAQAEFDPSLSWLDEQHLLIDSRRNGFPNLASFDIASQSFGALTNEQHAEQAATAVPGSAGKWIVFASNRSGEFHIWRFDSDTNVYTQLTFGRSYDEQPSVSPDGKWLVYTAWSDAGPHLMKVSITGGASQQLAPFAAKNPQISPDGKSVACYLQESTLSKSNLAILDLTNAARPRFIAASGAPFRWSPDGQSLTIARTSANGVSNIWTVPVDGGAPKQLTSFDDQAIIALAWSPSGDRVACLRETVGADVALFKSAK